MEMRNGTGELRVRARASEPGERRRVVLLLFQHLDALEDPLDQPVAAGPFSVFPAGPAWDGCLALWHRDEEASRKLVDRLAPALPLLDRLVPSPAPRSETDARQRFVSLLSSRMRGAERRKGRLALLLMETVEGDDPGQVRNLLRSVLRGGDWVEEVGRRVYTILDEPDKRVFEALGARLRALPVIERLQVVALGWSPQEGNAEELVDRADRIMAEGQSGEILPGVTG